LSDFLNELISEISDGGLSDKMEHLQDLNVTVKEQFARVVGGFQWLRNSFMLPPTEQGLLTKEYEKLIGISRYIHKRPSD
jgi:hypothetical protein